MQFDKTFNSPAKLASSIQESPKYPSIDLNRLESANAVAPNLDKSEEIDISDLIKMEKSAVIQVPTKEEIPAKVEPAIEVPKKI